MNDTSKPGKTDPLCTDSASTEQRFRDFIAGKTASMVWDIPLPEDAKARFEFSCEHPYQSQDQAVKNKPCCATGSWKFYYRYILCRLAQKIDINILKIWLYRKAGVKIAPNVFLSPDVLIDPLYPELVTIEEYAIIGWGTQLFTHEFDGNKFRLGKIVIRSGAVIGGFSIVRGGVVIGENARVSSMSIVYKDVEADYAVETAIVLNRTLIDVYRTDRRASSEGKQ